jgi:hypothetical protein
MRILPSFGKLLSNDGKFRSCRFPDIGKMADCPNGKPFTAASIPRKNIGKLGEVLARVFTNHTNGEVFIREIRVIRDPTLFRVFGVFRGCFLVAVHREGSP